MGLWRREILVLSVQPFKKYKFIFSTTPEELLEIRILVISMYTWRQSLTYQIADILLWLVLHLNYFLSFQKHPPFTLDSLLVTVWGFMLMKTLVSTSCMFPVKISCFSKGIFYSDVIQHVILVGVFTNDSIYTVFSFAVV